MHHCFGNRTIGNCSRVQNIRQLTLLRTAQLKHRMNEEVGGQPSLVERHADRVDQKRHVIRDNLDDGVRRLPAVLLQLWVVDVDFRASGFSLLSKIEVRYGCAIQVFIS